MRFLAPSLGVLTVAADLVTKQWALSALSAAGAVKVTPFFNLVLVWNTGVSFGLMQGHGEAGRWGLVLLACAVGGGLVFWLVREKRVLPRCALWLVLAGALGNVIDRLRFGAVIDFLDFHLAGYHWPAFNVADSAIVIGAALLLIDGFFLSASATDDNRGEHGR